MVQNINEKKEEQTNYEENSNLFEVYPQLQPQNENKHDEHSEEGKHILLMIEELEDEYKVSIANYNEQSNEEEKQKALYGKALIAHHRLRYDRYARERFFSGLQQPERNIILDYVADYNLLREYRADGGNDRILIRQLTPSPTMLVHTLERVQAVIVRPVSGPELDEEYEEHEGYEQSVVIHIQ